MTKHLATINLENINENATFNFRVRSTARAVVFDENNFVALLPVSKHNYYKLPDGGIEDNEKVVGALKRECLEEIGCEIEIGEELGTVVEYRPKWALKQISHCYLVKVIGKKGTPKFTDSEIGEGFLDPVWVPLKKAIELVTESTPNDYQGNYIIKRDEAFLNEASKIQAQTVQEVPSSLVIDD